MPKLARCPAEDAVCSLRRCYLGLRKEKDSEERKGTWECGWMGLYGGTVREMGREEQEDNVVTRAHAIGDIWLSNG